VDATLFVCLDCGTFDTEAPNGRCKSCGGEVQPLDQAMDRQLQLFEISGNDRARNVLRRLQAWVQSAGDKRERKAKALADAEAEYERAGATLMDFFKLTAEGNHEAAVESMDAPPLGVRPTPPLPPERPRTGGGLDDVLHEAAARVNAGEIGPGVSASVAGDDPLLWEAADVTITSGLASASLLQRRLKVGFARAGVLLDALERLGIVGPAVGTIPRQILITDPNELNRLRYGDVDDLEDGDDIQAVD